MGRVSLADELERGKQELIDCWRQRVQGSTSPADAPAAELLNSLPLFIEELTAILRREEATGRRESSERAGEIAVGHGSQRFHAGFSLGVVIREYGILRECLFDFIRRRGLPVDLGQIDILAAALNAAIANGAEEYARQRDQAIERQSTRHFGFIAHELRNPLGSALLSAQVLQQRQEGGGDVVLQRIIRNLTRLRDLIDNSLLSIRLRTLQTARELELDEVSLRELAEEARDDLAGDAEEKGIRIQVEGEARTRADSRLIRSVIGNLTRNAVKYTRPGGAVQVRMKEGNGLASLEVEDECGGLPEGKAEELFVPFVQRGADRSGFGLGLAITKDAVEAHQGTVQATSLPGKGCVFMVTLPLRRA